MTLTEYLSSPLAIEDVRALLAKKPERDIRLHFPGESIVERASKPIFCWCEWQTGAWRAVAAQFGTTSEKFTCYYRQTESGFVVSDCGESVSGIMRRTGKDWNAAMSEWESVRVRMKFRTTLYPAGPAMLIRDVSADDLPAALVSVLSAVAKCAEVK